MQKFLHSSPSTEGKVYKLRNAVYGLKQSPRELGLIDSSKLW